MFDGMFGGRGDYAGEVQPTRAAPGRLAGTAATEGVAPGMPPRPAAPDAYPNLADVPERPTDLPSIQDRIAIRGELEADLAAAQAALATAPARQVAFEPGSATLTPGSDAVLDAVAAQAGAGSIRLVGHAGGTADPGASDPAALARARADTVAAALVQRGVDATRINVDVATGGSSAGRVVAITIL